MKNQTSIEVPKVGTMSLISPAFRDGAKIPKKYSRDGLDKSPPLVIGDVPPSTKSLVLIMDDPDAPRGLFTHWVLFNLDPRTERIEEDDAPVSARAGANSWGEMHYGGPKPPSGEHRYFFHLYALDTRLDLSNGARREVVERALQGHVLAEAVLMGRFAAE